MLEQHCRTCKNEYDYFARTATIVCNQNHVLCKMCADQLARTNGTCPYCNSNPYAIQQRNDYQPNNYNSNNLNNNNNYANRPNANNQYWQPNQMTANNLNNPTNANIGQPYQYQPYPNNQPFQPNNQGFNPVPLPAQQNKAGGLCFLAFLFIIGFGVLLGIRTQMDRCEYWHYQSCYYYQVSNYMCCDNYYTCPSNYYNCYYINEVQKHSSMVGTTVGCALCAAFALICFVSFVNMRKRDRNMANAQPVYVRV